MIGGRERAGHSKRAMNESRGIEVVGAKNTSIRVAQFVPDADLEDKLGCKVKRESSGHKRGWSPKLSRGQRTE